MKIINGAIAVAIVSLTALLMGCGSDGAMLAGNLPNGLPAPILQQLGGKSTSGVPIGIFLSWARIADPSAVGYYIYRDTVSIPDPAPEDDIDPLLRVNGGVMLANPVEGDNVVFNDIFAVEIGTEYFYRVTVVDDQVPPQESPPSNEMSWVAHGHNISGFSPTSAFWGEDITITGDTFGVFDEAVDLVVFEGVGGLGVDGEVQSWAETEIVVRVPVNADTGLVSVVIDGTIAQTDGPLTIRNPIIDSLDPNPGFVGQPLTLIGREFIPVIPSTMELFFAGEDLTTAMTDWNSTQITFDVPEDSTGGEVYITVNSHESNRIDFSTRAELLSAYPLTVQSGELVTLAGRFLGLPGKALLNGTGELTVDSWDSVEVVVEVVGGPGPVTLTLETLGGVTSNALDYEISLDLAVTLSGLDPAEIYLKETAPSLGVETPADVDRVEIYVDGTPYSQSNTVPFDDLVLPIDPLVNGTHDVLLRAYRRTVIADSNIMPATVYSLVGDIDADGVVGDSDALFLELMLGLKTGDMAFFPWYDTNADGVVDESDLAWVGYNYGNTVTP